MDLLAIGARIKYFRKKNQINQGDLAREIGINAKTISLIENGKAKPNTRLLSYLAEKHHLNMPWVMTGKGEEKSILKQDKKSVAYLNSKVVLLERELEEMRVIMEEILKKLSD